MTRPPKNPKPQRRPRNVHGGVKRCENCNDAMATTRTADDVELCKACFRELFPVGSVAVEEDGDEVFTPMPKVCRIGTVINKIGKSSGWENCGGAIRSIDGFWRCEICGASYGPVDGVKP